jgi:hypothetical protein
VALAKVCLAADPEARPRDASAVATAISAHQQAVQERLRAAEVEGAAAAARADSERQAKAAAEARAAAEQQAREQRRPADLHAEGRRHLPHRRHVLRAARQGRVNADRSGHCRQQKVSENCWAGSSGPFATGRLTCSRTRTAGGAAMPEGGYPPKSQAAVPGRPGKCARESERREQGDSLGPARCRRRVHRRRLAGRLPGSAGIGALPRRSKVQVRTGTLRLETSMPASGIRIRGTATWSAAGASARIAARSQSRRRPKAGTRVNAN